MKSSSICSSFSTTPLSYTVRSQSTSSSFSIIASLNMVRVISRSIIFASRRHLCMLFYDEAECVCLCGRVAVVCAVQCICTCWQLLLHLFWSKARLCYIYYSTNPPYQAVVTLSNQAVFKIHLFYTIRFSDKPFSTDLFIFFI